MSLAAAARLRWRRYDVAFIPERSLLTHLVAYLAGIPRRYGRWVTRDGLLEYFHAYVDARKALGAEEHTLGQPEPQPACIGTDRV